MLRNRLLAAAAVIFAFAAPAYAAPEIGKPAPAFTATDSNGKTHTLADFIGKPVVLEWTNHDCPFVKKHYGVGNMQKLQAEATGKGAVWLSVISSAPGKQGHVTGAQANAIVAEQKSTPTAVLIDEKGDIGKLYGAKTTPHMFVIDKTGTLAYMGAIDDKSSTDPKDIASAKNYVIPALDAVIAGTPVAEPSTKPYGCGVKY